MKLNRIFAAAHTAVLCTLGALFCLLGSTASTAADAPAGKPPIRIAMIEGMSGAFANAGEAVQRNLQWAIERANAHGGISLPGGARPLQLVVYDSKGNTEEALVMLRKATDEGITFIAQGNGSAAAAALIDAINKHNARVASEHSNAAQRVLFLNYSAVDPALTNEACSFWHFRFDANADMRLNALTEVMKADSRLKRVYLIGQDYSFGRQVAKSARAFLAQKRPDVQIMGDELHPIGKVKDFAPYAAKIAASGADAVVTGNWGNDLTLLVKAVREAGLGVKFYTFYGNSLGAPAAMGDAGVGRVRAVAEWHPNVGGKESDAFVDAFRKRYPNPRDDYQHMRMSVLIDMLASAISKAGSSDAIAVAHALEGSHFSNGFHEAIMRREDHQLIQPLYVSVMEKAQSGPTAALGEVHYGNEGSGYGFRSERYFTPEQTALVTSCKMERPEGIK